MKKDLDKLPLPYKMTQQEVADELGITRESVAAIERDAIKKLKKILLEKYGIDGELKLDDLF